ncbi:MAG: hypothetical protein IT429_25135 [Gemmataceae bacterium]|nr:hypothetical protein [Gemmataceae bacterium]
MFPLLAYTDVENMVPVGGITDAAAKGAALGFGIAILTLVLLVIASTIFYFKFLRAPRQRGGGGKSLLTKEREAYEEMMGIRKKKPKKAKKAQD